MMTIDAKDVMTLRARTGLGMMDCKQALAETKGDLTAAEDWLRKKLKGKMDARASRAAGEGAIVIEVSKDGRAASIVELRAETDFTARNEKFVGAAQQIAQEALKAPAGDVSPTPAMQKVVENIRITTGENASIARVHTLKGGGSTMFGLYRHHDGKTGVLIQGEGSVSADLLRDVGMHITAAAPRPQGVTQNDIPGHIIERERKFALEEAMESGKPKEIAEKMVEGKMRKFFEGVALLEQPFVKDPEKKVKALLPKGGSIVAFLRWSVGETA